jgi:putative membrane protein
MAKKLTEQTKQKIEERIAELESKTSIEFVPVIARASSNYWYWKVIYALVMFSFSLILILTRRSVESLYFEIGFAFTIFLITGLLLQVDFILRALLPANAKLSAVENKAHDVFLHEEVFGTSNRSGILIFISEFERAVFILADKGFAQKVPAEEWAKLGTKLAHDFMKRSEGETFLVALDELSNRLSKDFPPVTGSSSQLRNSVREI